MRVVFVGAAFVAAACAFDPSSAGASAGLGGSNGSDTIADSTGESDAAPTVGDPSGSGTDASEGESATSSDVSGPSTPEGWTARRELTIDVTGLALLEPMHDVPVLVVLAPDRIDYGKTQPKGEDLRFRTVDETELPYEIELWAPGERSFVWVLLPSVDPIGGAVIRMDYGNVDANDEQDPLGVWSNEFVAVWHLGDGCGDGADDMLDSSGNGLHAACVGLPKGSVVEGLAGRAVELAMPTHRLDALHQDVLSFTTALTIEAFVSLDADTIATEQSRFAVRKFESYSLFATREGSGQSHGPRFNVQVDADATTAAVNTLAPGWHAIAGTALEDGRVRLFVDGVQGGNEMWPNNGQLTSGVANVELGTNLGGLLDEVRISAVARSTDWLVFQDASMRDQLLAFGGEVAL